MLLRLMFEWIEHNNTCQHHNPTSMHAPLGLWYSRLKQHVIVAINVVILPSYRTYPKGSIITI